MTDVDEINFPDNCPPIDANSHNGSLYFFVKNNPPHIDDFRTAFEKGFYLNADLCLRHSLSCGKSLDYLDSIHRLFPSKRGWKKAKGQISFNDGKIKQTGENKLHYSFWVELDSKLSFKNKFEVI